MAIQEVNRLLDYWQLLSHTTVTLEQRFLVAVRLEQLVDLQMTDQQVAAALAPLIATQPSQLSQFQQFYLDDAARRRNSVAGYENVQLNSVVDRQGQQENKKGLMYLKYLWLGTALCLLLLFGVLVGYPLAVSNLCDNSNDGNFFCPTIVDIPPVDNPETPIEADGSATASSESYLDPVIVPVSLEKRRPSYRVKISNLPEVPNTALFHILLVTLGFGLIGFVLPFLTRLVLRQTHSHWPTRKKMLDSLALAGLDPLHLTPEHFKFLPRLRYHEAGPIRLDVDKSVTASSKRGLPVLKHGARLRRRELVFIIPCFRLGDWRTDYFLSIANELRDREVQVLCFYYQHSPQFLTRTCSALDSQRLSKLLGRYDTSTFVFCINAAAVFHPEFGHRLDWTDALAWRYDRVLLSDVPMRRAQSDELSDAQIHLIEFSDRVGPEALLAFLASPEDNRKPALLSRTSYELPDSLVHLGDPAGAAQMPDPAEIKDLIRWLKSKLGRPAFGLLCATAVFPDADWRLARLLASRLTRTEQSFDTDDSDARHWGFRALFHRMSIWVSDFVDRPKANTETLRTDSVMDKTNLGNGSLTIFRRLAQLPWCQQGRYPLWLRTALVEELGGANESRVSQVLRQILERSGKGHSITQYTLVVDKPEHGLGTWWRYFSHATPVQDVLFVSVVSKGILGFELPAVVSRLFRNSMLKLGHYWPAVVLGLVSAVTAGVLAWLLYQQLTEQLQPDFQLNQAAALYRAENATVTVTVRYQEMHDEAADVALGRQNAIPATIEGFRRMLQGMGYKVEVLKSGDLGVPQNRVTASPEQLNRLVDILSFHTYGLPIKPVVNSHSRPEAEILLVQQVQSGHVFRDAFIPSDVVTIEQLDNIDQSVTVDDLTESLEEQLDKSHRAEQVEETINGFIPPEMVVIPSGSFQMGSDSSFVDERPIHQVTLPSFELSRNELTWGEWQLCEDAGGCNEVRRPVFFSDIDVAEQAGHPLVNVNMASINEYLRWISTQAGQTYRLPSEAEWEYAARAGSTTAYTWGNLIGVSQANCIGCGSLWDGQSTAPVGSFTPNKFGLNDVHGNVWERVTDCWHNDYSAAPEDGTAWVENCSDIYRSPLRGGSWNVEPEYLHTAVRSKFYFGIASNGVGFRLARTLP